jgi:kynureninase
LRLAGFRHRQHDGLLRRLGPGANRKRTDPLAQTVKRNRFAKSLALGDLFLALVEQRCAAHGFSNGSAARAERGSQVGLLHPEGYAIMQALIARGVIGDFRAPDMLRFGFAPLYNRYTEVWDAVDMLASVMNERAWDTPKFRTRAAVT